MEPGNGGEAAAAFFPSACLLSRALSLERAPEKKEREREEIDRAPFSGSPLRPPFAALSPSSNCRAIVFACILGLLLVEGRGNGRNRLKEGAFCSVFFFFLPWRKRSSEVEPPAPAEKVFSSFFLVAVLRANWRAFCPNHRTPFPLFASMGQVCDCVCF